MSASTTQGHCDRLLDSETRQASVIIIKPDGTEVIDGAEEAYDPAQPEMGERDGANKDKRQVPLVPEPQLEIVPVNRDQPKKEEIGPWITEFDIEDVPSIFDRSKKKREKDLPN